MTLTATTRTHHPNTRIALLIGLYVLLGLIGLAFVGIAAWASDPCSPDCTSASGSSYADLQESVLGLGGIVYLLASIPLAAFRARRAVWLVPVLAFAVVTIGVVALLSSGARGGECDCGFGVRAASCSARAAPPAPRTPCTRACPSAGRARRS